MLAVYHTILFKKKNMKNENKETIGNRIGIIRKHAGLTQEKFSQSLGLHQQSYSRIENDKRKPSIETLALLAKMFNVNLHWLITGEGDMFIKLTDIINRYQKKEKELKNLISKFENLVNYLKS